MSDDQAPLPSVSRTSGSILVFGVEGTAAATKVYVTRLKREIWYVNRLLIHADFRGRGAGAHYLAQLIKEAWAIAQAPIVVEPGGYGTPIRWLRRWYRKQGFRVVPETRGAMFIMRPPKQSAAKG